MGTGTMLQTLLFSQPARTKTFASTAFSTVTHGALIAAALGATGQPNRDARAQPQAVLETHVTYVTPAMLLAALKSPHGAATAAAPRKARAFVLPNLDAVQQAISDIAPVDIPAAAEPDLTMVASGDLADSDSLPIGHKSLRDALGLGSIAPIPVNGAYTESMVDRAIIPRRGNPSPRYPAALQSAGIEGDFMVQFVVDSTGKVDPDHIQFPNEMHRLFVDAVRTALLRARFFPAQIAGKFVAQHAIQEFKFTLSRDR